VFSLYSQVLGRGVVPANCQLAVATESNMHGAVSCEDVTGVGYIMMTSQWYCTCALHDAVYSRTQALGMYTGLYLWMWPHHGGHVTPTSGSFYSQGMMAGGQCAQQLLSDQ
jgi:hypothetical protein